jgi:transcriptional regulator NrdR family protein
VVAINVCSHSRRKCIDTRPGEGYTRRRYECRTCSIRFTTVEVEVLTERSIPMLQSLREQYSNSLDVSELYASIKSLNVLKKRVIAEKRKPQKSSNNEKSNK